MTAGMGRTGLAIVLTLSFALLLLATRVSDGFFLIDEAIYYAGADTLYRTGSLAVHNGFAHFLSPDLRVSYLVNGPQGLVPQYPVGPTFIGATLIGLLGQRSLIFLNVVAGIGSLFVTHAIARHLFRSKEAANVSVLLLAFCTFWIEYAVGQWPHSIALLFTSLAVWLFVIALDRDERAAMPAALSGMAVGAGVFFRLEAVLLLPAFVALAILFARRPVALLAGGVGGLVPFIGLLAIANDLRFGTANPLSYGSSGGATDAKSYLVLGILLLGGLGALTILRVKGWPRQRVGWLGIGIAAAAAAALALSPVGAPVARAAHGAYGLLIDATTLSHATGAVQRQADGTLLFWGLPKKALGQSMPWLGCLALLAAPMDARSRRSAAILLVIFAVWSLPFAMKSWFGGYGSNMRYFLSTLPLLTILAGWLLLGLWRRVAAAGPGLLALGFAAGVAVSLGWVIFETGHLAELHQFCSLGALAATAALCLLAARVRTPATAQLAFLSIAVALGLSSALSYLDFQASQARRAWTAKYSAAAEAISGRAVFYAPPDAVSQAFDNPDHLVALPDHYSGEFDQTFIDAACRSGYRVLLIPMFAPAIEKLGYRIVPVDATPTPTPFSELVCKS